MAEVALNTPPVRSKPEPKVEISLSDLDSLWPAVNTGAQVLRNSNRMKELEAVVLSWNSLCSRISTALKEIEDASIT